MVSLSSQGSPLHLSFDLNHAKAVAIGTAVISLVLLIKYIVYQVFFHPLARYPGPFLAKLTDAHQLWHGWIGDRHLLFLQMHEKYGPVVRYGPNHLSFNTVTALKKIYGHNSNIAKSEFYNAFVHGAPNIHNTRNKEIHSRKRRIISNAFSTASTKSMEPFVHNNIRKLCELVGPSQDSSFRESPVASEKHSEWSVPQNMAKWFSYLTMDVLGDLCYGKSFDLLEKEDNRYSLELLAFATKAHLLSGLMPLAYRWKLDYIIFRQIASGREQFAKYGRERLNERTALGNTTDRKDFFHYMLNSKEGGYSFSQPELWGESTLLLIAGSDTTAASLAATLFYLVRYPEIMAKVMGEVRSKFSSVNDIGHGSELSSCVYLRACIDEAMRLSPAVGGLLPREVISEGTMIDSVFVPAGTIVGVPHYALQHNTEYHKEPFQFVPERWIEGVINPLTGLRNTAADIAAVNAAFCPFSIGPRGCIGKGLAYHEMTNTLARLLWLYDIRKAEGVMDLSGGKPDGVIGRQREDEYQLMDTFTSITPEGPFVQFRNRVDM
ncbi:Cytochrome P450 monooxygenase apf7 [Ceratocystis fimbriata CBS 114723]|uniref:Cytochrome P450 monooxygenase apf7 n=1 Tax=Ceratocystis fimbriata CBS 114723 TaxID=1035309 RepID=A0A2C5WW24_9PEZI|nr:Cytochrome P450 monooxygenase apf7 [Ceratocystis fimbriata CBS 114723]